MKKIVLFLILIVILATGCSNIYDMEILEINKSILQDNIKMKNQYRSGYKYYLPRNMRVLDDNNFNEILNDGVYNYYLYIDAISYYNKKESTYQYNKTAYYSEVLKNGKKEGYLEINLTNEKYLVEMMYNYAKIEVIVNKEDVKTTVANAITILSSTSYNRTIINNLMGDNVLNFSEKEINIFETKKTESNFIHYVEQYDSYEDQNAVPDLDLVK